MKNPEPIPQIYEFGDFRVDAVKRRVAGRDGQPLALTPRVFDTLLHLVRSNGKLLEKDELMAAVWPDAVVEENNLSQNISTLRRLLGENPGERRYIATVPGRGYRFVAAVKSYQGGVEDPDALCAADPVLAARDVEHIDAAGIPHTNDRVSGRKRAPFRALPATPAVRYALLGVLLLGLGYLTYDRRGSDSRRDMAMLQQAPASTAEPADTITDRPSIAVLPFLNLSADANREYIATGIAETVLHQLASLHGMTVIARTSSFAFKNGEDVREIGRKLNTRYLLEGSVQSTEDRLRVTAQLVDSTTGDHVWSQSFDRPIDDIFAVQDEIALKLAERFELSLGAGAPDRLSDAPPDLEAHMHYLIGRDIMRKREPDFLNPATEQFTRAIDIDPQYAEAHAELALASVLTAVTMPDPDEWRPMVERAQESIDTARALKPGLSRADVAQGLLLQLRVPPDYAGSEAVLRRALALEPTMVDANTWLARALTAQDRYAESLAVLERTARIDPLASPLIDNLAISYANRGDVARAEQILRQRLELPQPSFLIFWSLQNLYFETGRLVESNDFAKRLVLKHAEASGYGTWYSVLSESYARLGLWKPAEYWIARNEREKPDPRDLGRFQLLRREGRYEQIAEKLPVSPGDMAAEAPGLQREYGSLQALAGDYRKAIRTLEPLVYLDASLEHEADAVDAHHALAWAYLETGATDRASRLLNKLERRYQRLQSEGWLHVSRDLALFAQNALLAGDQDLALDRLRRAVDAGWRDYYLLISDPRWQSLKGDPRFEALMGSVKADIDVQRARVEQIEADDDFPARLDQVLNDSSPAPQPLAEMLSTSRPVSRSPRFNAISP